MPWAYMPPWAVLLWRRARWRVLRGGPCAATPATCRDVCRRGCRGGPEHPGCWPVPSAARGVCLLRACVWNPRVDDQRWRAAQSHEATLWTEAPRGQTTDRNAHHAAHFGNYAALPESLGHVVELGCGPYTQLQTILRPSSRVVSITLVDPLAVHYQAHAKGCTYKVCCMARRACAWVKRRGAHPHLLSLVWRV